MLLAVIALLTAAQVLVFLAQYIKVPSLLAYLLVGIALGPHGLKLLSNTEEVVSLAEFGVVFLMFSIGLEFSLSRLRAMQSTVFGLGGAQVGITAVGTILASVIGYGQRWKVEVWLLASQWRSQAPQITIVTRTRDR